MRLRASVLPILVAFLVVELAALTATASVQHAMGRRPAWVIAAEDLPARFTSEAPKPKPGRALRMRYLPCPEGVTTCRLILSWTRPANYNSATDTATVTWRQVTPIVTNLGAVRRTRGTADTITVGRPTPGTSKTGLADLCYVRAGWTGNPACNAPFAWSIEAPVTPPDTATGLKLSGIIVKPDSFKVTAAKWKSLGIYHDSTGKLVDSLGRALGFSCPAGGAKCPQQQFCAFAAVSDNTVGMTSTSAAITFCRLEYDKIPGHRPTYDPVQVAAADLPGPIEIRVGPRPARLDSNFVLYAPSEWVYTEVVGWTRGSDGIWRYLPKPDVS